MKVLYERIAGPAPACRHRGPLDHQPGPAGADAGDGGRALAARGETRQARHVASVACAVGRWTMALMPVLSLEPSAVRVLTGP
jgi:hypothetical protein